jgi:tetratricopeptide (TPR) repeat protein
MIAEFDAFFSYRRKDLERAKPLLAALESAGVRVWRDEHDLADNASITAEIRNAIARSKALIALYSVDYPLSHACFEELSTAWIAAQQAGELPYSRVLVLNPEPGFDHVPAVLREQQSMRWPADASGFAGLAERIGAVIGPLTGGLHKGETPARPEYHPVAVIAAPRFVGRVRELWDLHGQLTADRMSIISGVFGPATAQVRGMGGNGKSMLAREYAIRFGAAFPGGVFWLNAFGNDDSKGPLDPVSREALRRDQVRTFAVRCGVEVKGLDPEQVEAAFWAWLQERGEPCLWIVDDLPSGLATSDIEGSWAARWAGAATLITTRSTEYRSTGQGIDLEMLGEDEAIRLLTSRRPLGTEDGSAREIVRKLGCHPLAVEVAGSYIARGFALYSQYLAALSDPDSDAVEFGAELREALPTGHKRSISTTLLRSVRMLGADGMAFLELASVLAVAPIPVSFVQAVFNELPEPRPRAASGIDEADSLSLAKMDGEDARTVHTLVARAVRSSAGAALQLRSAAIDALLKLLPGAADDVRRHGEIRRELVHARHLVASGLTHVETIVVAGWIARHDSERGDYAAARPLWEQVLEASRRLLGAEHPVTLTAMNDLAQTVQAQGDLAGARELQEQVLEARRRLLGAEHLDTLTAMHNLAQTVKAQGDLAGARELQEQVLEATRWQLGAEHPQTLRALSNLARTVQAQGDLPGAKEFQEQVLDGSRRLLGAEHPDTLTAMNNLAITVYAQGDLAAARELQHQVLEASRRLLGAEHPNTLTAMHNLAQTVQAQGDMTGARELQEQVLEARRRLLGVEHPDTLRAMGNLALTVQAQGDLAGARELQEQVLEASRWLLGAEHPDTLRAMSNLAQTAQAQGDLSGAKEIQEQVLEASLRLLGAEHPDTLTVMNNLATTVHEQGDLAAARELQQKVLDASLRLLGAEHPDTLRAMSNLAHTAQAQGDLAAARELQQRVLEARRRLLGSEHPNTSIAAWNFFCTILDSGDRDEALTILQTYFYPLFGKDPDTLSADQKDIIQAVGAWVRGQSVG